jgi:glycine/D-amino acid oxidase-like deaminating enzyme
MGKDVVIVGAGILGCATAYFLAREGVSVAVLDPVGVGAAASGRNNGIIEHPYDDATVALFDETVELLREALGESMPAEPVGTLLVSENESDAHAVLAQYERFPVLEPELLEPDRARDAEPLLGPDLWGCLVRTGYPIRPLEATTAFADLARGAGAEFVLGSPIEFSELLASGSEIVVAAGAATADVLGGRVPPEIVKPLWGVIVSVELPTHPQHPLIEGTLAAVQGGAAVVNEAPFTLLDSPSYLAVGSTMLQGAEPVGSAWTRRLLSRGTQFVPSIEQARVRGTLVCARPRSFDNRPILGRVSGHERLWIATGHGGRGMSLGAASARLLADAIRAGSDAAIPAPISATRISAL